ncbi:MAG: hypothetical protein KAV87_30295 [Desulfobacteraceae bacterium]|nr:hypothetical protein [Desulfobacteraceae bacterium]
MKEGHRSHIGSKEAKARGWGRVPDESVRAETYSLGKEVGVEFMNGEYLTLTATGNAGVTTTETFFDGYGNSAGTYWPPYQTWVQPWYQDYPDYPSYPETITIREIIKEKVVTKEVEQRTLYKVYVVDPRKGGRILTERPVIAENENQAMVKANVLDVAVEAGRDLEELDVYVQLIGTFIRPRKDTQRVKVVKTDEED